MSKLSKKEQELNNKFKFNNKQTDYIKQLDEKRELIEKEFTSLLTEGAKCEVMPMGNYVLILPWKDNPFEKIKTDSGLIIGGDALQTHFSQETGEIEKDTPFVQVGTVIETGPDCKFLKPEDTVYFTIAGTIPVPFYQQGWVTVNENRIIAVVAEGLTERKQNYIK